VRAVVQIARSLGKTTVAEGVEDERTLELLRDYGVDYAQGYYIGRPEPFAPAAPKPSDALPHADRQSQAASASMSRQLRDDASRPEAVDKPVADAAAELTYGELAEARDVAAGLRDHDADVRDLEYERNEKAVLAAEESKLHALLAASKEARRRAAADRASADDVAAGNGDRAPEREEQNLATATEISESTNKALAESSQDARDHSAADRAASRADRREAARDRDEAGTEGERAAADEPTGEDG
ncbi:MAG: EAL domain-containing protein, partial [Solirubrobacterales bacterium]